MPARVHALLVVRPDGRTPAAFHLRRTLAALTEQTRRLDALTIVVCGADANVYQVAATSQAESVITAPASTRYADAARMATARIRDADAVWLLAQDTAPEPEALARLAGSLELSPSVAFVAPKLVRWDDRTQIVSLGVSMTRYGRAVGLADGDFDQGQHDVVEDVLGADVRGMLVRAQVWRDLGLDRALLGADEGLDLGVRARLAGGRIALVPRALVAVSGDGVAGLPAPQNAARRRRIGFAVRTAQLHRRLVYANPIAVVFHWLAVLPLAVWRTVVHLVRKEPGLIVPEWGAAFIAWLRVGAVFRARRRIAAHRSVPWSRLAPLRVSQARLRERLDDEPDEGIGGYRRGELRFFAGGGAWLVLAAIVASAAVFTPLLAWSALGGGGLEPLRSAVVGLWADAAYGQRAVGLDTVGPADPFSAIIAILGTLSPWQPSRAIVVLWLAALPLAALGGWFAAVRVTERSGLRITAGIVWALAPTFLIALTQGRPAAVLVHLLLPWLFFAASVAHRSWSAAGGASLLLAAVLACAPSLAPAAAVLLAVAIIVAVVARAGLGLSRLIWLAVPSVALATPLAVHAVRTGDGWGLLADPGPAWNGPQVAADVGGRALLAAGIPTSDLAGWATILPDGPTWWVPLLAAPLALLALMAPLTQRWAVGAALLLVTAVGIATAFAAVGVSVAFAQSLPVALWPGNGLSLAWLGATMGALVALDAGLAPRVEAIRAAGAFLVAVAVAALAAPSATALARGTALIEVGGVSTLPAYVAAEGRDDPDVGTMVLTPQNGGGVSARVVWGGSETLGGQATIVTTRTIPSAADVEAAEIAADLMTSTDDDVVGRLASHGIRFVLLAPAVAPESDAARTLKLTAATSLNQRADLDAVGDTTKGSLWRVTVDVADRAAEPTTARTTAGLIAAGQLAVVAIALLLAFPTAASRRVARRTPRVVGPHWQERR
ncbi:hypothetical protein GCM10022200_11080 [Microbacterium awajiense]|uniref:Glycosyl transferase n=1 Tax=Microbacterium awajiense TaxID=415214 RepID=A0ABP7AE40_9MICO